MVTHNTEEQEDLIEQFLGNHGTSAKDREALGMLVVSPSVFDVRRLVLKLAKWCYYEGYNDADEASR